MGNSARKPARARAKQLISPIFGNKAAVTKLPFGPCFMNETWRDEDDPMPALVSAVVTRVLPGGQFHTGVALVDRTCLGIKNAFKTKPLSAAGLGECIDEMSSAHEMEEVLPLEALSVVYHAIDYAAKLGFAPHPDFPAEIFEPRPQALLDTPYAAFPKPYYVSGPEDDVEKILRKLDARLGKGNYHFTLKEDVSDFFSDDDD